MRDDTRPCLSFELVKLAKIHRRVRAVVPVWRITFSFQSNLFARESPSLLQTRRKRSNWKKNFSATPDDVLHARWVPVKTIFHWVFLLFFMWPLFLTTRQWEDLELPWTSRNTARACVRCIIWPVGHVVYWLLKQYRYAIMLITRYRDMVKQLHDVKVLVLCESRIVLKIEKNHDE